MMMYNELISIEIDGNMMTKIVECLHLILLDLCFLNDKELSRR